MTDDTAEIPDPVQLSGLLLPRAPRSELLTYAAAARALGLMPPLAIHRLTLGLEALMARDAALGAPFLSSLVISRARGGLPAPGFFIEAARLGRYAGPPEGPEAGAFHSAELARLQDWADTLARPRRLS